MSEDKKDAEVEAKPAEDTTDKDVKNASDAAATAIKDAELAAEAAEAAEKAAEEAIARSEAAKQKAEAAAEEEYKVIAAEVKAEAAKTPEYSFKRQGEEIFRREMGEPEFWLEKEDRFPRPILTADEQASLTRTAETPQDQTPAYIPEHVLSPEFKGTSNYERGVDDFLIESKERLQKLKNDPESTEKEILTAENNIKYLESLHENFYIGMNVFRTAKGGRNKIS